MHKTMIYGRVGRDPEQAVDSAPVTFSVAVDVRVKGEKSTVWYRVVVFNDKAKEFALNYIRKGARLNVWGRLSFDPVTGGPRVWVGKDGEARASFELMSDEIGLIDWPDRSDTSDVAFTGDSYAAKASVDDIPF